MNRELFKKIHEVISADPERLHMSTWESPRDSLSEAACGTTRCIAGWAVALETGTSVFNELGGLTSESLALAERLGVAREVSVIAAELLDLSVAEAQVFYTSDETGAEFVRLVAEGKELAARELLRR